ncbi:MAG: DsbA family protein [Terracidiphilus sp.]
MIRLLVNRSSIRLSSLRLASIFALVGLFLFVFAAAAQHQAPAAAAAAQAAPAQAVPSQAPSAPAPASAPIFPKPDPANFTASSPSKELVNAFIQANLGFDDNNVWEIEAILKTPVEGVSRVFVLISDKGGKQKPYPFVFYTLPDGKHIIARDDLMPFSEHPFAENRSILQAHADGPYRGSASKDLEIVEFADFQCPHCKEAQPNMDKLAVDYPKARIIYQSLPLPQHSAAMGAAEYGVCVNKLGGSDAFFTFASAVYDGQDGLATADGATLTLNSAVTKAGLDPAKVSACASTPETKAAVDASVKLAQDLKISQTPTLMINGRPAPASVPYETLKQIVRYEAKADGVAQ